MAVPPRRGDGARVQIGKGPKRNRARGSNVWTQSGECGPLDELTEVVRTGDEVEETASGHDVTPRALRLGGGRRRSAQTSKFRVVIDVDKDTENESDGGVSKLTVVFWRFTVVCELGADENTVHDVERHG